MVNLFILFFFGSTQFHIINFTGFSLFDIRYCILCAELIFCLTVWAAQEERMWSTVSSSGECSHFIATCPLNLIYLLNAGGKVEGSPSTSITRNHPLATRIYPQQILGKKCFDAWLKVLNKGKFISPGVDNKRSGDKIRIILWWPWTSILNLNFKCWMDGRTLGFIALALL